VFDAYCEAVSGAVARGGRYDEVGKAFGRPRAATGFSIDLRALAGAAAPLPPREAILAPCANGNAKLAAKIAALRRAGEVVIEELPGHARYRQELGCARALVRRRGAWVVKRTGKAK
jgi:ATP phosphoribosyltransferase regulatory subunit